MGNGGRDEDTLYPPALAPAFVSSFFPFPRQLHSGVLCLRNLNEKKKNLFTCFTHALDIIWHFC